jgi:hypothetical protein
MSTYTAEPGTRLAGRYRLVDQIGAGAGWVYWKATDETLARPVTVLTFALGFPRLVEAVTAARAASRLTDPRFAQVFDVEDAGEVAYVVSEWVVGESLLDMLSEGPLDPSRAAGLVLEAAQAVAAAHATGLAHLRLDPACVHWTLVGGVKISGLGIDAALAGTAPMSSDDAEDPALADTRELARLLYLALTGYWPGPHEAEPGSARGLPPAPENDGSPCTPRQVSAAVPASIDAVTCQALFQRPSRNGPALTTPAMFADALAKVAPRTSLTIPDVPVLATRPVPARGGYQADEAAGRYQPTGPVGPLEQPEPMGPSRPSGPRRSGNGYRRRPGGRSSASKAIVGAVIVVVLAAAGVAWSISRGGHHGATPATVPRHSTAPSAAAAVALKPVGATSFGPGGGDDTGQAQLAIDGSTATAWHTSFYIGNPVFGGLQKGTGLLLDMGKQVRLSQVVVQFGTTCCAHAQIAIGNDPAAPQSAFTVLQSSDQGQGSTTFSVTKNATGRYVLIWLTYLPSNDTANRFQAFIHNVSVRGSTVSQSG